MCRVKDTHLLRVVKALEVIICLGRALARDVRLRVALRCGAGFSRGHSFNISADVPWRTPASMRSSGGHLRYPVQTHIIIPHNPVKDGAYLRGSRIPTMRHWCQHSVLSRAARIWDIQPWFGGRMERCELSAVSVRSSFGRPADPALTGPSVTV